MQVVIDISEDDLDVIKYLKVKGWASRHELQILNGTPFATVIEDIKAEIEHIADYTYGSPNYDADLYNGAYKDGLYEALDIIDKHISGKENE